MLSSFSDPPTLSPSSQQEFPWPVERNLTSNELICNGQIIKPSIHARMEKGFQMINGFWTCYRRNYFETTCAYDLAPVSPGGRIFLRGKQVQAFGMGIAAAVEDSEASYDVQRTVDILQFTPKRDNTHRRELKIVKLWPGLPLNTFPPSHRLQYYPGTARPSAYVPQLPFQDEPTREDSPNPASPQRFSNDTLPLIDNGNDGLYKQHTFDRLQFKTATANNGKRRASQQYYRIRIQLFADVRSEGANEPHWIKVCEKISQPLVVRGRSPNHYKEEDKGGQDADEREGGEPGASGSTTPSFGHSFGYGSHHYGSPEDSRPRGNVGGFRGYNGYDFQISPDGSPESSLTPPDHISMHYDQYGDDVKAELHDEPSMEELTGYTYNPTPLYEAVPAPIKRAEQYQEDTISSAFRAEYPRSMQGMRWHYEENQEALRGVCSSSGYYPANFLDMGSDYELQSQPRTRPDTSY